MNSCSCPILSTF